MSNHSNKGINWSLIILLVLLAGAVWKVGK